MGGSQRLADHFIDDAQFQQIFAGESQGPGGLIGVLDVFPENAGATLGADDRIVGELQYRDVIADADSQRSPGTPFSNHHGHDGHCQSRHNEKISRNRFCLPTFLCTDPWVGAGCINESENRTMKLFS